MGRFGSLIEFWLVIFDEKSAGNVCACVVVHNFLIVECWVGDLWFDDIKDVTHEDELSWKAERSAEIDSA